MVSARILGQCDIITLARLWDEQPLRLQENLVPAERLTKSQPGGKGGSIAKAGHIGADLA